MELPELMVPEESESELDKVQLAQEFQRMWETDFQPTGLAEPEKQSRSSADVKQETYDPSLYVEPYYRPQRKESSQFMINEEPLRGKKDVWSDSIFLENLNSFLFLENPQGKSLFNSDEYFDK